MNREPAPHIPFGPPEAPPPEGTLLRLFRTMGLLRQVMEPFFAQYGLSGPQWAILRVLQRAHDEGETSIPQREISRRMLIQPPSVTTLVDRLERQGLLSRRSSAGDLRVRPVALTSAGRDLVGRILASHSAQVRTLFAGLSRGEVASLHDLLGKMSGHLHVLASSPHPVPSPKIPKATTPPKRSLRQK